MLEEERKEIQKKEKRATMDRVKTETQTSVAGNSHTQERKLEELLQDLTIDSDHENSHSDKDEDRAVCPSFIQTMMDFGVGGLTQMLRVKNIFQMCITVKNVECEHF